MTTIKEEHTQQLDSSSLAPYFVEFIRRIDPGADPLVFSVADMVVRASEAGNICLPLFYDQSKEEKSESVQDVDEGGWPTISAKIGIDADEVGEKLLSSMVVGRPGEMKPLILDQGQRLYLYRYWKYEKILTDHLLSRAQEKIICENYEEVSSFLTVLFPGTGTTDPDWQKIACSAAYLKNVCVICGGPGTGKTSTVVKLMALFVQMAGDDHLKFGIAAPTGKAAARLQDSIQKAKRSINGVESIVEDIPEQVQTIHRLLGYRGNSPYFVHNSKNLLDLDVLIVDEASMIDLALMAKLFDALPDPCRVILLGDKDQLASVEAGRVLGDICGKETNGFSSDFVSQLKRLGVLGIEDVSAIEIARQSPLFDSIVILEKSYRFDSESGIGKLAQSINSGNFADVSDCFEDKRYPSVHHNELPEGERGFQALVDTVCQECIAYLNCSDPEDAFIHFERFRLLCVHRKGMEGVLTLNAMIEGKLAQNGLISMEENWYPGKPILVTKNDYRLQLFNGDTGITMRDEKGDLRVFFLGPQGTLRSFSPLRVPPYETAFAITVHKSQGSEFDHVALLLPQKSSILLSRELFYTAVTRARKKFTLWGDISILPEALARKTKRSSGLAERLYGKDGNEKE